MRHVSGLVLGEYRHCRIWSLCLEPVSNLPWGGDEQAHQEVQPSALSSSPTDGRTARDRECTEHYRAQEDRGGEPWGVDAQGIEAPATLPAVRRWL